MPKQPIVLDATLNRLARPVGFLRYLNSRGKWQVVFGFSDGALYWDSEEFDQDTDATFYGIDGQRNGVRLA